MMDEGNFSLKWDEFPGSVASVFDHLRQDSELVDITLCCEGQRVRAHRMMLSACSPYFRELFKGLTCQQLVIFLKDTSAADLTAIVEFMYRGSVSVAQSQLPSFIKTAKMLQIRGLSGDEDKDPPPPPPGPVPPTPPEPVRARSQQQQPAKPAAGLRRVSDTAGSPAEPRLKRRRAEPPPAERRVSPPPPPPPPAVPPVPAVSESVVKQEEEEEEAAEQRTDGQCEAEVKVEKCDDDMTPNDGDEETAVGPDVDLDHGYAHHEGHGPGSDQSLSADGRILSAAAASAAGDGTLAGNVGPGGPHTAGPSQQTDEDGSQDGTATCQFCGVSYDQRRSLLEHMKTHISHMSCKGLMMRCSRCHEDFAGVHNLRQHMTRVHSVPREDVDVVTGSTWIKIVVDQVPRGSQKSADDAPDTTTTAKGAKGPVQKDWRKRTMSARPKLLTKEQATSAAATAPTVRPSAGQARDLLLGKRQCWRLN